MGYLLIDGSTTHVHRVDDLIGPIQRAQLASGPVPLRTRWLIVSPWAWKVTRWGSWLR